MNELMLRHDGESDPGGTANMMAACVGYSLATQSRVHNTNLNEIKVQIWRDGRVTNKNCPRLGAVLSGIFDLKRAAALLQAAAVFPNVEETVRTRTARRSAGNIMTFLSVFSSVSIQQ